MKRVALLTIFFYCCTFAAPPQSRSAVPVALLAAAAIGATMVSTSAGTYYAQTGQAPEYVKTASNAVASAADAVFQPSYLAQAVGLLFTPQSLNTAAQYYAGKAAAVGASIGDIVDLVANSAESAYADLKGVIAANSFDGSDISVSQMPAGAIFTTSLGRFRITAGPYDGGFVTLSGWASTIASLEKIDGINGYLWTDAQLTQFRIIHLGAQQTSKYWGMVYYDLAKTDDAATWTPPGGGVNYPGLADALSNPSSGVSADLQNAIKNLPDAKKQVVGEVPTTTGNTTAAPTLTSAEIAQLLKDNAAAVARAAAEAAQAVAAANPTDAAAQIAALQASATAAQAAADAAQNSADEPQQETFSPISDSPFGTAYNPGPFDIPTRFTTFLQNVKSSGLFSFSSAFFDSLPGGGSPVYTVNAGHYGTHTVDLSDTMTTGLAVLKSILLACFGFLSIRAVIMKR